MTTRDRPEDAPDRFDFRAMVQDLEAAAPTEEQVRKATERLATEERDTRLRESRIEGAITPEDWRAIVSDELLRTHALSAVRRWFNARSTGQRAFTTLVLVGETGRGKTLAGAWLLAQLGGRYITSDALRQLKLPANWRERDRFEALLAQRVLVIDDAGTELDAASASVAMYEIVNGRQGLERGWTLITANIPRGEFVERYGERTISRIEHQGFIVEVTGDNLRRRKP